MDKIDILGLKPNESYYVDTSLETNDKKSNHGKDEKSAADFASFVRDQSKSNIHLNLFSKKLNIKEKADYKFFNDFDFKKFTKEEISVILARCFIKSNEHVVAINKPRGISVQGDVNSVSIEELVELLGEKLSLKERLHIVHRLDKDTTGVLLLARNADSAFLLKNAFKERHVRKNYICLTHGIPCEEKGIIDFNLKEAVIGDQVVIRPDMKSVKKRIRKDGSEKSKSGEISTAFNVLCSNYNIALVQCAIISGVKHQIRAHLAYGLETPILGDHKYSWLIKENKFPILPQQLSPLALTGLNMKQGKIRNLPIHLHAHHLIIGEPPLPSSLYDGKANLKQNSSNDKQCRLPNFQVYAKLPDFFYKTLKSLKLQDRHIFKFALKQIL